MPMLIDSPELELEASLVRSVRIRASDITMDEIAACNQSDGGVVVRFLKQVFGFDYVWTGNPLFSSRVPLLDGVPQNGNFIEGWKGDTPYFAETSPKFWRFMKQIERLAKNGSGEVNTLTEQFSFRRAINTPSFIA